MTKRKMSQSDWFSELKAFARTQGIQETGAMEFRDWEDFYHDGYTPEQAYWEDLGGG